MENMAPNRRIAIMIKVEFKQNREIEQTKSYEHTTNVPPTVVIFVRSCLCLITGVQAGRQTQNEIKTSQERLLQQQQQKMLMRYNDN